MSTAPAVLPDQMDARCINGHVWRVEMTWEQVHDDPVMRVPGPCFPPQCPRCALPVLGFSHISPGAPR